jgi:RNA polymerase sigma-70 factor (ECF subfamily)
MLEVTGLPISQFSDLLPTVETEPSREELVARLQRLDVSAWEDLFLYHNRTIRGLLVANLGYSEEVDDVAQQVFETALKLVTSRKVRLRGDASGVRAWLIAIAIRLARKEMRRRARVHADAGHLDPDRCAAPLRDPVGTQLLQRTHQILNQLPERLRTPFILRHLDRMNLQEVAASMGVSLATIKRRLAAADDRFRKLASRDSVLGEQLKAGGES